MAHYAYIDENNIVTNVIVGPDENDGTDYEQVFSEFKGMTCKRTSYNTRGGKHINGGIPFRKNYAGRGYTYDEQRDAFIPPKPFESWVFDEEACWWVAPTPMPDDGNAWVWDENSLSWMIPE